LYTRCPAYEIVYVRADELPIFLM